MDPITSTIAEDGGGDSGEENFSGEIVDAHLAADREAAAEAECVRAYRCGGRAASTRKAAESAVLRGDARGALHGVPMSIKSCIDVAGWTCPAGSRLRADYVATEDAVLVARLRAAGAILLGNTNTPEFLMAYENDNAIVGEDEQSVGAGALVGRIERRRSGGDCFGMFDGRSGQRWRRDQCACRRTSAGFAL